MKEVFIPASHKVKVEKIALNEGDSHILEGASYTGQSEAVNIGNSMLVETPEGVMQTSPVREIAPINEGIYEVTTNTSKYVLEVLDYNPDVNFSSMNMKEITSFLSNACAENSLLFNKDSNASADAIAAKLHHALQIKSNELVALDGNVKVALIKNYFSLKGIANNVTPNDLKSIFSKDFFSNLDAYQVETVFIIYSKLFADKIINAGLFYKTLSNFIETSTNLNVINHALKSLLRSEELFDNIHWPTNIFKKTKAIMSMITDWSLYKNNEKKLSEKVNEYIDNNLGEEIFSTEGSENNDPVNIFQLPIENKGFDQIFSLDGDAEMERVLVERNRSSFKGKRAKKLMVQRENEKYQAFLKKEISAKDYKEHLSAQNTQFKNWGAKGEIFNIELVEE